MLGTNKTGSTLRLVNNVYSTNLNSIDFRAEPRKQDTGEKYVLKQFHVLNRFYCDIYDILPGDRISHNGKEYVVMSSQFYDDRLGQHIEGYMREIDSHIHEEVLIRIRTNRQDNYDPILKEFIGGVEVTTESIKVLLDPMSQSKNEFIKIVAAGKLEDIDYIMQVDFPQTFKLTDKLEYEDETYSIMWRYKRPYDRIYGLKKEIKNYQTV